MKTLLTAAATGGCTATAAALAMALSSGYAPAAHAADCFDRETIGLYSERHYSERDKPWRDRSNDPKIDSLAETGLRSLRADVRVIKADALETALDQARGNDLAVLAYLDVEATSSEIPMQFGKTDMVSIETALRLQFLSSGDGSVLGESSDFGKTAGLDIEQALPEMLQARAIATMAEEAGREACRNGLSSTAVVAEAKTSSEPAAPQYDPMLVTDIQFVLNDLGYDVGTPDGIAGGQTQRVIKQAQADFRFTPINGVPSESLLTELNKRLVTKTQTLLQQLGKIKDVPLGVLNRETKLAIQDIERENDLSLDGEPDGILISVLEAKVGQYESSSPDISDDDPRLRQYVEELLVDLGYLDGVASGQEGDFFVGEAIRRAEKRLGLNVDGRPDKTLYRKLVDAKRGSS